MAELLYLREEDFRPNFSTQVEPEVLERVGVVVDHLAQATRSGEFSYALKAGHFEQIDLARWPTGEAVDIGDAACGRLATLAKPPRLAFFTGLAVQDLCTAVMVYEKLSKG